MNKGHFSKTYFSISNEIIPGDQILKYDLFVNSSSVEGKEKFVRFFKRGKFLKKEYLNDFISKYKIIYVSEDQRRYYVKDLLKSDHVSDTKKMGAIKEYAVDHLLNLFHSGDLIESKEDFQEQMDNCKESVEQMIELVQDKKISEIQEMLGELSYHDFYTYDHSINVGMYSIVFYKYLKPSAKKNDLLTAGLSGLLHDLGKMKVPNSILNNTGKLSDEDFEEIKKHPNYGLDLFKEHSCSGLSAKMIQKIEAVIFQHHENVNGTGYPEGLKANEIDELSRVVAVIDFFDAVTTKRSYHEPLSVEDALNLMERSAGMKLDEKIFGQFKECVDKVVFKGKEYLHVEDDFDPCRPYETLPLKKVSAEKIETELFEKEKPDYGKVKVKEKKKNKAA